MLSAWDRLLARRAATIAATVSLLVVLIIVTTDDGATWARRAAMCAALAPVSGSLGALSAARIAQLRGETGALCALGVSPARAALGAILGGIAVSLPGACMAVLGWADMSALFPTPPLSRTWVFVDGGILHEPSLGIAFAPGGHLSLLTGDSPAVLRKLPAGAAASATVAVVALSVACPAWAILAGTPVRRAAVGLFALGSMLLGFALVGAASVTPLVLAIGPLALLVDVLAVRYRAGLRR